MKSIVWKLNKYPGVDPQTVADEILAIGDDVTPRQIVEKARDPQTQLHRCFTWDDSIAAEKWRLQEARLVVCNLVYRQEKENSDPVMVRVLHKTDCKDGYKPLTLILQNQNEYEELIERCREELRTVKNKYQQLSEFEEIWELIQ